MQISKKIFSETIQRQNKAGVYILVALSLMEKVKYYID